jgi:hypothetical protein
MMEQQILAACTRAAVATALDEAKATPIAIGESVGHTNFATYGTKAGKLVAYEGDEAVVEQTSGEQFRWPSDGMVDIKRVWMLTEQYYKRLSTVVELVGVMDMLGVPPSETLNQLFANDGPTPGCTCEYCKQFTPEQHEAARQKLEGTPNPGEEQAAAAAAAASAAASTDDQYPPPKPPTSVKSGFPFDDFLDSLRGRN